MKMKMKMCSNSDAFFRPILPDFLTSFSIPESFLKKLNPELENGNQPIKRLCLVREEKKQWEIDVEEGCHLNAGQWKKFAQEYDLKVGGFLVFRHLGNLVFQVYVFDPNTSCEILSPHFTKPSKQQKQEEDKQEEKKALPECSVTVTSYGVKKNIINLPKQFVKENGLAFKRCDVILIDQNKRKFKVFLSFRDSTGQSYIYRGCKAFMIANRINPGDVIKLQKLVNGGENPTFKCCTCPKSRQAKKEVEEEEEEEEEEGVVPPVGRNVVRSCDLTISSHALKGAIYLPRKFARENGLKFRRCDVTLIDKRNRSWKAWLHYQDSNGQSSITRGWKAFLAANRVKSGDVVRLQLLNAGKHPVFKCSSCPKPKPKPKPKVEKEEEEEEKVNVVPCSSKRRRKMLPSCHLTITSHGARKNIVYLPAKFAKENGLVGRSCDVTVIDKKRRSWKMQLRYNRSNGIAYVNQGWKGFRDANHIKVGDTIRIQLLSAGDYPVFECWRRSRGRKSA